MTRFILGLATLGSILSTTVVAHAQTDKAAAAVEKFKAMDTDQDGALSRDEWKAAGRRDRGFNYIDADKDGKVTPAELQAAAAKYGK